MLVDSQFRQKQVVAKDQRRRYADEAAR
jgi:hypothetical protein